MLTPSYFFHMMLKKALRFFNIDRAYGMVTQSKHYLGSKEGQERLRHKVDNSKLSDFRMLQDI